MSEPAPTTATAADTPHADGRTIVNLTWAGTGLFVGTATAAAVAPDTFGIAHAVLSCVLFGIGCVAFLWAYGVAVARSRTDAIGIGGLYFLAGTAPTEIRRRMLLALAIEVVTAVVSSSIRPFTSVAFGVLAPVFGLGLCGLWSARYGVFAKRAAE